MKRATAVVFATLMLIIGGSLLPATAVTASQKIAGTKISVPGGSYRAVTPRELSTMLKHKNFLLVNVHYPYEGELPHTDRFIHYDVIGRKLTSLPGGKHAMIVLYCRSGNMSDIAARTLVRLGYTNVWHLAGGMNAWQEQGFVLLHRSQP